MSGALPDLARYDRFGIDTETTGEEDITKRRPVGASIATPDGKGWYIRWGHDPEGRYGGGNNCSLGEFIAWARVELTRPHQVKAFFNAPYDLKMLVYAGALTWPALVPGVEDAGTSAALLNENERSYALESLLEKHLGEHKEDEFLNEWCAAQFGGRPWRSVQAKNYWRAPGEIVEPYAISDAAGTLKLHDRNRALIREEGLEGIYRVETDLIPVVVNMHFAGVRVDREKAERVNRGLLSQLRRKKNEWAEIAAQADVEMGPNGEWGVPSSAQAAAVFKALGVPAVGKTAKGNPEITKEMLEAAAEGYEPAAVLLKLRELAKLSGTFVESYILDTADEENLVHGEFHPLPVEYKPGKRYGTVSGRLASWLHNVPGDRNPEAGRLVRGLFIPWSPDHRWVKADYSQIEYRFLGHYAGGSIARAYNESPDVDFHQMLADLIARPDICNRRRTKNVNFAKVYGAGLAKAALTAGISVEEWKKILAIYDDRVPEVDAIYKLADRRAQQRGYIVTWGGRKCRFISRADALRLGFKMRRDEAFAGTYKALNRLLQGSAADLIKKAMVRIAGPGGIIDWRDTFLHLTVHDELDASVPRGDAEAKFVGQMHEAMEVWGPEDGPPLGVPIKAEIKSGESWGDLVKG